MSVDRSDEFDDGAVLRSIAETIRVTYPSAADLLLGIERMHWPREAHRLQAENTRLRAAVAEIASALERTERNFRLAVNGKPVRDMAENLAENARALASVPEPSDSEPAPDANREQTVGCTCGFGGFHDDINPRCELSQGGQWGLIVNGPKNGEDCPLCGTGDERQCLYHQGYSDACETLADGAS